MKRIKYIAFALLIGLAVFFVKSDLQAQQARATLLQIKQQQERDHQLEIQESLENSEKYNQELNQELEKKNQENQQKDQQIQDLNKQLQAKKEAEARLAVAVAKPKIYSGGCESYRPLFVRFGWDVNVAMAIMQAESGCNPNAVSPTNDHGLMQLHAIAVYDPAENIRIAYEQKYLRGGWGHWTVYKTGAYLKYLRG